MKNRKKLVVAVVFLSHIFILLPKIRNHRCKENSSLSANKIVRTPRDNTKGSDTLAVTPRSPAISFDSQIKHGDSSGPHTRFSQRITSSVQTDLALDKFAFNPIEFSPDFKNPCWYEKVDVSNLYRDNIYGFGELKKKALISFERMQTILKQRSISTSDFRGNTTWMLRCLPYFYLAGVDRCGSTDLAASILLHQQVLRGFRKEYIYWNRLRFYRPGRWAKLQDENASSHTHHVITTYPRSFKMYVEAFDEQAEQIRRNAYRSEGPNSQLVIGDYTPSYLWDFPCWRNLSENAMSAEPRRTVADYIKMTTPKAKVIIVLRNPVDRLFSDFIVYPSAVAKTKQVFHNLSLTGIIAINACLKAHTVRQCVFQNGLEHQNLQVRVRVGIYFPFVEEWMSKFPNQIMIIRLETYTTDKTAAMKKVFEFLSLEPAHVDEKHYAEALKRLPRQNTAEDHGFDGIGPMLPSTRFMLEQFYGPWNEQLAQLLQNNDYLWKL